MERLEIVEQGTHDELMVHMEPIKIGRIAEFWVMSSDENYKKDNFLKENYKKFQKETKNYLGYFRFDFGPFYYFFPMKNQLILQRK